MSRWICGEQFLVCHTHAPRECHQRPVDEFGGEMTVLVGQEERYASIDGQQCVRPVDRDDPDIVKGQTEKNNNNTRLHCLRMSGE